MRDRKGSQAPRVQGLSPEARRRLAHLQRSVMALARAQT